ncbi:MAG: LCP family protein [Thermoclostridium sp.]|nr:LCP family protein [Thermoclostridium sp.]
MKKGRTILFAVMIMAAGIIAGVIIFNALWTEQNAPGFSDTEKDSAIGNDSQQSPVVVPQRDKGLKADYKLTNGQKYYIPLVDQNDKNVLLIGEDASSGNWDTIIIASVSEKSKKIRVINIPRDIYMDYSEDVLSQLREKSPKLYEAKGFQKINAAHSVGAKIGYEDNKGYFGDSHIDFLADLINEIFQIPIDDYAYVNTKGFRDIVDLFGGVELEVPLRMKYEDPEQDLYIDLQPGFQHLNAEQAEGFVRFRQGYDKNGIFQNYGEQLRKENQNRFIEAFFKQHVTLKNLGKVDDLTKLVSKNVRTSVGNVKAVGSYVNLMSKALNGEYVQESMIIEVKNAKKIDGVFFDVLRTE